jgi:UDP-N-acetylglucosamine 2-epimerase (non-hydrolysing)
MLSLTDTAGLVITDSGGVQEETTHLGVPCLTVRPNTERPITITEGTNRLVASTRADIVAAARNGKPRTRGGGSRRPIERWDGRAGERIAEVLVEGKRYD